MCDLKNYRTVTMTFLLLLSTNFIIYIVYIVYKTVKYLNIGRRREELKEKYISNINVDVQDGNFLGNRKNMQ